MSRSWTGREARLVPDDAFPLAAKPEHRRISSNVEATRQMAQQMDALRLTVLSSRPELNEFLLAYDEYLEHMLFLEYVEGLTDRMYTIGVYADREHEVLGMFTGRKVRGFPPDIGDCRLGQVEELPLELKALVKKMCRDMGYHGIAEFEFKKDAETGAYSLIEVNPRSWSWVGITPACSVSLPWIAYADLTGLASMTYTESEGPTGSVKWVRLLEDLPNCLFRNQAAGYPDWNMSLREWWRSLGADHLVVAEFAADDPLPGVYSVLSTAKAVLAAGLR